MALNHKKLLLIEKVRLICITNHTFVYSAFPGNLPLAALPTPFFLLCLAEDGIEASILSHFSESLIFP